MHRCKEKRASPNIQIVRRLGAAVLVLAVDGMLADRTQAVIRSAELVVRNVHVVAVDVGSLRVSWAVLAGTWDITVAFAHVAEAELHAVAEGPVLAHAAYLSSCVTYGILNITADKATVLVGAGFTIEWVVPKVVAKAWLKDTKLTAVISAARPGRNTVVVGVAAFLK